MIKGELTLIFRETIIVNKMGLHARPAATFAKTAAQFQSTIKIRNLDTNSAEVNAKSIVRVLTLDASLNAKVRITADGEDAQEAVNTLISLIDSGLDEES